MTANSMSMGIVLPAAGGIADVELAQLAEAHGSDSVWITENFFTRGAFALAGAVATNTDRLQIATGTVSPLVRHPAVVAMEAAALAELSNGRFRLGLGVGSTTRLAQIDIVEARPLSVIRTAVRQLQAALGGPAADVAALPELTPPCTHRVPVLVGASGPRMLALAGAEADGALLSLLAPHAFIVDAVATVENGATSAGRDRTAVSITAFVPLCLAADRFAARRAAKRFVADNLVRFAGIPSLEALLGRAASMSPQRVRTMADQLRDGADPTTIIDDNLLDEYAIAGDADDGRRQLARWLDLGIDNLALLPVGTTDLIYDSVANLVWLVDDQG